MVLGYNVPGVSKLVLTREQIVGIYNGSLNNWSDPTFAKYNPGTDLPNAPIVPVARYDSSGSTEIFTSSLSSFSAAWSTNYGVFNKKIGWNSSVVKVFGQRNSGMADYIMREPYRIGYLSAASANEVKLPYASTVNKRGRVTDGGKRSVQTAMDERAQNMTSRLTSSLIDCEGEETYPIAGYSYFIVHMTQADKCSVAVELARYIEWFLTCSQAEAEAEMHFMIPVSPDIANRIRRSVLERMTCNGQSLMDLVRQQKYNEEESLKTWKLPVQIASPLTAAGVLFLIVFAIRQRVKYLRTMDRDDWKINFFDIDFVVPKKSSGRRSYTDAQVNTSTSSVTCLGRWNIHEIVTRSLSIAPVFHVNRKVKQILMCMRDEIGHENIARFFGLSSHNDAIYLVEQYCSNGRLVDFLRDNQYIVDQSFHYVVCADIANGMTYLHRQNLIHGNLSIDKCHVIVRYHVIDKCHVDSRWTIKIVDWEYPTLHDVACRKGYSQTKSAREKSVLHFICGEGADSGSDHSLAFRHVAPEIYRKGRLSAPTRAGDVFSFGFIIQDVFLLGLESQLTRSEAFSRMPDKARQIMEAACDPVAINRPTFDQLKKSIRSVIGGGNTNLLDRCVDSIFLRLHDFVSSCTFVACNRAV